MSYSRALCVAMTSQTYISQPLKSLLSERLHSTLNRLLRYAVLTTGVNVKVKRVAQPVV